MCHRDTDFLLSYPAPSHQVISLPLAPRSDSPQHYLRPTPDPMLYCFYYYPTYPEHYFPRTSLFNSHTLFISLVTDSFHSFPLSLFVRSSHTNMVCAHRTALNHGLYSVAQFSLYSSDLISWEFLLLLFIPTVRVPLRKCQGNPCTLLQTPLQ